MRTSLLTASLWLCACGPVAAPPDAPSPDAVTSDAPSSASADAPVTPPLPVPFYEVPTTDPALAPHAFFAVPDVHYVTTDGIVELTYDFPEQLSGVVDQEIILTGPIDASGNATLSGTVGTGTCSLNAGIVRCIEFFSPALALDPANARALAATYSTDPGAVASRAALIDQFASDPIGIVVFDLATASEPSGGD